MEEKTEDKAKGYTKIQEIIIGIFDFSAIMIWAGYNSQLLGLVLENNKDWEQVTLIDFFESKLWFNLWVASLFYVGIRAVLRGEFWEILFKRKNK